MSFKCKFIICAAACFLYSTQSLAQSSAVFENFKRNATAVNSQMQQRMLGKDMAELSVSKMAVNSSSVSLSWRHGAAQITQTAKQHGAVQVADIQIEFNFKPSKTSENNIVTEVTFNITNVNTEDVLQSIIYAPYRLPFLAQLANNGDFDNYAGKAKSAGNFGYKLDALGSFLATYLSESNYNVDFDMVGDDRLTVNMLTHSPGRLRYLQPYSANFDIESKAIKIVLTYDRDVMDLTNGLLEAGLGESRHSGALVSPWSENNMSDLFKITRMIIE